MKPKIYVFVNAHLGGSLGLHMAALAEDGTPLGGHVSSSVAWGRRDMGMDGGTWHHDAYSAHYPEGYDMEFVETPDIHEGVQAAFKRNLEKYQEAE